jgi:DNA-binding beta-propeller fold protein YncE
VGIAIDPTGHFVYVTNAGDNDISRFQIITQGIAFIN